MNTVRNKIWGNRQATGSGGGGGDNSFNGERDITRDIPQIEGFDPNTTTVQGFLEQVFYPPIPPESQISVDNPIREIGQTTAYTLTWDVVEETNTITGITVDGIPVTPTGGNQSGTQTGNVATASGSYTKNMSATDGTLNSTASCTIEYLARMFWGTTAKDGLTDAPITDADILALANSGLVTTKNLSLSNFGGGNTYLIFAIPSMLGNPQFIINGLINTAFTCVRATSIFVNSQGANVLMDVWVSNNLYNSPLDTVIVQ